MDDALSMFDAFAAATTNKVSDYENEGFAKAPKFVDAAQHRLAAQVVLEKLPGGKNCTHHRLKPANYEIPDQPTGEPARTYPFTLDEFQKKSIDCLERGESVLVCAHTSAGKTAVAEYAIAMGLRDKRRIIYTSPIKALSNQKYRNLCDEFVDVGLMTGDVTLNPDASVMVMTTEILRSMLYRGSEIVQEMKWVIFDEVHYMRDAERGVVWEETIILIPQKVHLVFLSATIPNSIEFAEWICRIKNMPCNVISTDYRPTPLQHYIYAPQSNGVYLVVDDSGRFRQDAFLKAVSTLDSVEEGRRKRGRNTKDIESVVAMCHEKKFTPVIVFAFSKAECEANATAIRTLDMTDEAEKNLITEIYQNAMATLADDDRTLPQAVFMLPLLRKGVGIHHGGLLPIIKEIIEILFQEGLIKVLFSTETFSMGVNMPARCVVFTSLNKWDGQTNRLITSGEYIQMAGRAGRRGLDEHGLVIIMMEKGIKPEEAKSIFMGKANRLDSSFHLGYNMLLNLIRIENTTPEFLIERSFLQFQRDTNARSYQRELLAVRKEMEEKKALLRHEDLLELTNVHALRKEIADKKDAVGRLVSKDLRMLNFLNFGRLVKLENEGHVWEWGIVFATPKVKVNRSTYEKQKFYIVDCLVLCDRASVSGNKREAPLPTSDVADGLFVVVPFSIDCVKEISQIRMQVQQDFRVNSELSQMHMRAKYTQLLEYLKTLPSVPMLDPVEHIKIDTPEMKGLLSQITDLEKRLSGCKVLASGDYETKYNLFMDYVKSQTKEREVLRQIEMSNQIVMKEDLRHMKAVLKELNYVDENGVVTIKGNVACEINATDELVVAEMFLRNFFENMEPEYICASLSCLVVDEKKEDKLPSDLKLVEAFKKIQEIAREIATVMAAKHLDVNVEDFVKKFKPAMMTVVLRWAKGHSFTEVMAESNLFEGSVIRCVRRLEELLRQLACTSRNIGNLQMEQTFVTCIKKLKKGIIFTSSLYL
ncbi:DSHCT (NUC185) domain containing DEAD/DEAH box helicase family protein, putative [Babesia bigemina]|uniref:DSHCT (NUC185) domain containing DEAD/DEAH box helicase family protein, putative n=1 Tax=Babesia bigemina TaxID=5866 RepID=A0A061D0F2_BABBI|nr:DSHCT (NUC185) domain containing DEAD/DEAH box helicase family protein, putative [Babesia bigemina]CDR94153.1 DSHCT (NUC185) domain containing DEAD/DEAH box helicase family protein, putative [Babesia bigemina]|eukprot:XP_012766339.1 DSHCT (NUC185) domain containing DEAD/DEAH box helicase family protein, putative [Babesia bigemina]